MVFYGECCKRKMRLKNLPKKCTASRTKPKKANLFAIVKLLRSFSIIFQHFFSIYKEILAYLQTGVHKKIYRNEKEMKST